jgi:hypothetical protein
VRKARKCRQYYQDRQERYEVAEVKPFSFKGKDKSKWQSNEPAPDGKELVSGMELYIKRYLVVPGLYLMLALWTLATHAFQKFDCFPYIAVVSAVKRSGKTRLAEVLETMVHRPWRGSAPSPAALYRMLERGLTLMLDEVEFLKGKKPSEATQLIVAVLNAGHRKGGTVPRCEGPKQEVRDFHVYGPKLFAVIGRLPDTLMDRSIVVQMKRRTKAQKVERFRQAPAAQEGGLFQNNAVRFVKAHATEIDRAYQDLLQADLEFLSDRDADVWTPLFVMAQVAVPDRLEELRKCAKELSDAKAGEDVEDSLSLTLLRDLRAVWPKEKNLFDGKEQPAEKCETSVLIDKLRALEESPWGEKERPLTARGLARMLRPFEVEPRGVRKGDKTPKGYLWTELQDAFSRYLEEKSATCATGQ